MSAIPVSPPRINTFVITLPPYNGPDGVSTPSIPTGTITLAIPDNSIDFYTMGVTLAGVASSVVSLASTIQTIFDPTGGLRVKDALDPYQFAIVTQALTASGLPTPAAPPIEVTTPNPLGGALAGTGVLAGLAATAASLSGTAVASAFVPGTVATGIVAPTVTGFPDYAAPLTVVNASLGVISTAIGQIATIINTSTDVPSRALVLKSVLSAFAGALNTQAITTAGRVPPTPPTGL